MEIYQDVHPRTPSPRRKKNNRSNLLRDKTSSSALTPGGKRPRSAKRAPLTPHDTNKLDALKKSVTGRTILKTRYGETDHSSTKKIKTHISNENDYHVNHDGNLPRSSQQKAITETQRKKRKTSSRGMKELSQQRISHTNSFSQTHSSHSSVLGKAPSVSNSKKKRSKDSIALERRHNLQTEGKLPETFQSTKSSSKSEPSITSQRPLEQQENKKRNSCSDNHHMGQYNIPHKVPNLDSSKSSDNIVSATGRSPLVSGLGRNVNDDFASPGVCFRNLEQEFRKQQPPNFSNAEKTTHRQTREEDPTKSFNSVRERFSDREPLGKGPTIDNNHKSTPRNLDSLFSSEKSAAQRRPSTSSSTENGKVNQEKNQILETGNFQDHVWLDFGSNNIVGQKISKSFAINFSDTLSADYGISHNFEVERFPHKKGFSLMVQGDTTIPEQPGAQIQHPLVGRRCSFQINRGETRDLTVSWTPSDAGGVKEAMHLKAKRGRYRIVLCGSVRCEKPSSKKVKRVSHASRPRNCSDSSKSSATRRVKPFGTVEKSVTNLNFTPRQSVSNCKSEERVFADQRHQKLTTTEVQKRNLKASTPIRINPRVDIENGSIQQQYNSFTNWVNYMLKPTGETEQEIAAQDPHSPLKIDPYCLKKEHTAVLRDRLYRQRRAKARERAMSIFNSEPSLEVRSAIDRAVEKGQLSIRTDRDLQADLGLRQSVIDLLLSYCTPWLHLGLETVFGEIIPLQPLKQFSQATEQGKKNEIANQRTQNPLGHSKLILKKFIIDRVLGDPSCSLRYTKGKCKVPSGEFEKRYHADLRKHTLQKVLHLVFILDKSKQENVLATAPRLFVMDSKVKSSSEILTTFCRYFLSGEGNIIKHLSQLKFEVSYKQHKIDEFDFTVRASLVEELRDGIRLARLVELITDDFTKSLSSHLRIPAVSRLQKLHNVGVVLGRLSQLSLPGTEDVIASDIVDCHGNKLLKLLWSVVFHFKLSVLLDANVLNKEIVNVRRTNACRHRCFPSKTCSRDGAGTGCCSSSTKLDEIKTLLLQWCQAVCSCFGVVVENFTSSFADGKVLCYLIHFYHPSILPVAEIRQTTRDLGTSKGAAARDSSAYKTALQNEQHNVRLAKTRMEGLGGIPDMIQLTDSTVAPQEKTMIVNVAYLCSRLMESSDEILAVLCIQACYRGYRRTVDKEKRQKAASTIFKYMQRSFHTLSQTNVALPLVLAGKRMLVQRNLIRRRTAALTIQNAWRNVLSKRLVDREKAATRIQKDARRILATSAFSRIQGEILLLQRALRGLLVRRTVQLLSFAATEIQRSWRGYTSRKTLSSSLEGFVLMQSLVRGYLARCRYYSTELGITKLQAAFRRMVLSISYEKLRRGVIMLQALVVGKLTRKVLAIRHFAACEIQRVWRGCCKRSSLIAATLCIVKIQALSRVLIVNIVLRKRREAARLIQFCWNSWKLNLMQQNARTIQKAWKCHVFSVRQKRDRKATILIQCKTRLMLATIKLEERRSASRKIQKWIGVVLCLAENKKRTRASVAIQSIFRGFLIQRHIERSRIATCYIQSRWRCACMQYRFRFLVHCAIKVQAITRQSIQRSSFATAKRGMIGVQKWVRGHIARRKKDQVKQAVIDIQRTWRGYHDHLFVVRLQERVLIMQATLRMFIAKIDYKSIQRQFRKYQVQLNATRQIQSFARLVCAYTRYEKTRCCVIYFQANIRRSVLVKRYYRQRVSALVIQMVWRRKAEKHTFLKKTFAAVKLQASWRAAMFQREYQRRLLCLGTIQRAIKMMLRQMNIEMKHNAAIEIQRVCRGFQAQTLFIASLSAVQIQSVVRGCVSRHMFKRQKAAASTIQTMYRVALEERHERDVRIADNHAKHFASRKIQATVRTFLYTKKTIKSTLDMQRTFRGFLQRQRFRQIQIHARQIQRKWRRKLFLELIKRQINATVKLQGVWRAKVCSYAFERARKSIILVQRCVRGYLCQLKADFNKFSATEIQRVWRGCQERMCFILSIRSAIQIQAITRGTLAREEIKLHNFAAEKLQAIYRSMLARRIYSLRKQKALQLEVERRAKQIASCKLQHAALAFLQRKKLVESTLVIQRHARGHLHRKKLNELRDSASKLQKLWRKKLQMELKKRHVDSTVKLQAIWRARVCLSIFKRERNSVIMVQRYVRQFLRQLYVDFKNFSAVEIQRVWRGRQEHMRFSLLVGSAIQLQSIARGIIARAAIESHHDAAEKLQKNYRSMLAKRVYNARKYEVLLVEAERRASQVASRKVQQVALEFLYRRKLVKRTLLLQRHVRGHLQRKKMNKLRDSARKLQSFWRTKLSIELSHRQVAGAVKLQALWRAAACVSAFKRQKELIILLQAVVRRWSWQLSADMKTFSAIEIQRSWRGYQKHVRFVHLISSTTQIQSVARGVIARKNIELYHLSAKKIQTIYRIIIASRIYLARKSEAILMEALCRGEHAACRKIQFAFRSFLLEKEAAKLALLVQRSARGFLYRRKFYALQVSTSKLQRIWRKKVEKELIVKKFDAAVKLQASWRATLGSSKFKQKVWSTILVQRAVRQMLQQINLEIHNFLVTEIQRVWRGHQICKHFSLSILCLVKIQSVVRGAIVRDKTKLHPLAAKQVQKIFRSHLARRVYILRKLEVMELEVHQRARIVASRKIQSIFRRFLDRKKFLILQVLAKNIQSQWRRILHEQLIRIQDDAALTLQAMWRGHSCFCVFQKKKASVVLLQRAARFMLWRLNFEVKNFAASEVQRAWRGYRERLSFTLLILCAIQIQSITRGMIIREKIELHHFAAEVIQSLFRSVLAKRIFQAQKRKVLAVRAERFARKVASKKIQRIVRAFMYRRRIMNHVFILQRVVRSHLAKKRVFSRIILANFFQSSFRGWIIRRECSREVAIAAMRIRKANAFAAANPEMKLGNRTASALKVLLRSTRLAELIRAVTTIETATRLSETCCVSFVETDAPSILFDLVRTCNRSLPHIELLKLILQTLNNVATYPALIWGVAINDSTKVLIDLLQMFRDKEAVFCQTALLIYKFCSSEQKLLLQVADDENVKRLKGVHSICARRSLVQTGSSSRKAPLSASKTPPTAKNTKSRKSVSVSRTSYSGTGSNRENIASMTPLNFATRKSLGAVRTPSAFTSKRKARSVVRTPCTISRKKPVSEIEEHSIATGMKIVEAVISMCTKGPIR